MNTYCFADLHGNLSLYENLIEEMDSHGEWKAICLGDTIDRGPDGYEILKRVLHDNRITLLLGNHEDMFLRAINEFIEYSQSENINLNDLDADNAVDVLYNGGHWTRLHQMNGGARTQVAWLTDREERFWVKQQLEKLPLTYTYKQFDLVHGGIALDDYEAYKAGTLISEDVIWNRDHFREQWREDRVLVHGHTGVETVRKYLPTMSDDSRILKRILRDNPHPDHFVYQNGTKIDLDGYAFCNGKIALLNLDTEDIISVAGNRC